MKKIFLFLIMIIIFHGCGKDKIQKTDIPERDPREQQIGKPRSFDLYSYNHLKIEKSPSAYPKEFDMYSFIFQKTVFEDSSFITDDFHATELYLEVSRNYSSFTIYREGGITDLGYGSCQSFIKNSKNQLRAEPRKWSSSSDQSRDIVPVIKSHCYLIKYQSSIAEYYALFHVREYYYRTPKEKKFDHDSEWSSWIPLEVMDYKNKTRDEKELLDNREEKAFIDEAELLTLKRSFQFWRGYGDYWPSQTKETKL